MEPVIAEARRAFGDDFAEVVASQGIAIGNKLGGRFDLFTLAIGEATRAKEPIDDLYRYCLSAAGRFAVEGPPPKPVSNRKPAPRPEYFVSDRNPRNGKGGDR